MAKIGFLADRDNDEADGDEKKKKVPSQFQQYLEEHFSPTGEKENLFLFTTDDIRWHFHHMVPVGDNEINRVMKALGFQTKLVDDLLCWQVFSKDEDSKSG